MYKELLSCNLCPRKCNINRYKSTGYCKAGSNIKVARAALHYFEEPIISGKKGSGAIFFSGCNLRCCFCQNYNISEEVFGKEISAFELANIMIKLEKDGANNINLVTPTMYIPLIKDALIKAKKLGLDIPIIYNTSGYENVEILRKLDGLIDVYLPDFKYFDNNLGLKYSNCSNYREIVINAIKEMYRQVGKPVIKNNLIKKGVIVRHLVLPNNIDDSKRIIEYLYNEYKDNIYISIMNQYTIVRKTKYSELNRNLLESEYDDVVNYAYDLGVRASFIQEGETNKSSFIPEFDLTGL